MFPSRGGCSCLMLERKNVFGDFFSLSIVGWSVQWRSDAYLSGCFHNWRKLPVPRAAAASASSSSVSTHRTYAAKVKFPPCLLADCCKPAGSPQMNLCRRLPDSLHNGLTRGFDAGSALIALFLLCSRGLSEIAGANGDNFEEDMNIWAKVLPVHICLALSSELPFC